MNAVDLALVFLLSISAVGGYWRGFFRETFGLLALLGGIAVAIQFAAFGAGLLQQYFRIPPPIDAGVAFVVIFILLHSAVNLIGVLLDRLASALFLRGVNRFAGAVLGAGKGAAILGLLLLFLHLFALVPGLDQQVMDSTIGRPLVEAAGDAIRLGLQPAQQAENKT